MDVMSLKQYNHHCIVCGTGYHYCNDCNRIASFTPWRKIACSVECYQAHLAFLEYRDVTHDAKKFADMIDHCGVQVNKIHEALQKAYALGVRERSAVEDSMAEEAVEIETVGAKENLSSNFSKNIMKARRK